MQEIKMDEFRNSLLKWSRVLGTEADDLLAYILEKIVREEEIHPAQFTTFCREIISNPEDYKRFDQVITSSNELLSNLITKSGTDYHYLYKLADLLDEMGEDNLHVILLDNEFLMTDGEKFLFHPLYAKSILISDETKLDNEIQNRFMYKLPLNETIINHNMINETLERYAFTFYLLETLFPGIPFKKIPLDVALDFASLWHREFAPEYKNYILKLLVTEKSKIEQSCVEILNHSLELLGNSTYSYRSYQESAVLVEYGDRRGRRKRNSSHSEDDYEVFRANSSDRVFVMIADGVSTADLGRGEFISGKIREVILQQEEYIKEKLNSFSVDDHDLFISESRSLLSEVVNEINRQATEKVNDALALAEKNAEDIESPMSSTVLLGVICGNWCSFAHLGDSEIILRKNGESNIINLPHNVHRERILDVIKLNKPYKRNQEKDDSLTRVIPMTYIDNSCFFAHKDIGNYLDYVSFALEKGDMVLVTTDGLLSCLGSSSLRWKGLQELDRFISEHEHLTVDELIKKLLDHADKSSVDDIAVVLLKYKGVIEEKQKPQAQKKELGEKTSIQAYQNRHKL